MCAYMTLTLIASSYNLSLEREVTFSQLNLKLLENSTVNLISQEGFLKGYQFILELIERFKQEKSMISIGSMEIWILSSL